MNLDLRAAAPAVPGSDTSTADRELRADVSTPNIGAAAAGTGAADGEQVTTAVASSRAPKPRLRGMLHLVSAPVMLIAGLITMVVADTALLRLGCAVWTLTAIMLFGHSAVYHRGTWNERVTALMRRIDHSNIAIFIAGTYTPLAIALLTGTSRVVLLSVIWACALAETLFRTFWLGAPRWLYVALYLAMGWVAIFWLPSFWAAGGPAVVWLIAIGGAAYSAGAVVYARKSPNPSPEWFGFHEIFHTGTVIGAVSHWVAILLAVS